jgi:hypothetical protein
MRACLHNFHLQEPPGTNRVPEIKGAPLTQVAVVTPRQVMRQEFYNLVQQRRGRAVSGAHSTMITSENPGDLEEGENAGNVMQKSLPPLVYEFLGCLFLGLFINLGRVGPMAGHGGLGWSAAGMLNLAFGISGIT